MTEHMASRTYDPQTVYDAACGLLAIERAQVVSNQQTPAWACMAREAIAGAVYELCKTSYPKLAELMGHRTHSGTLAQVRRFRDWPRHMRRSWLEAVLTKLDADTDWHEQVSRANDTLPFKARRKR